MPATAHRTIDGLKELLEEQLSEWEAGDAASPSSRDMFDAGVQLFNVSFVEDGEYEHFLASFDRQVDFCSDARHVARLICRILGNRSY